MKKLLSLFLASAILFYSAPLCCDQFYNSCFKLIIITAACVAGYHWYYDTEYNPFKKPETNQNDNQLSKEESKGGAQ